MYLLTKLLKIIFLLILVGFAVLVLWMNLTAGHLQPKFCTCGNIEYLTDKENEDLYTKCDKNFMFSCSLTPLGKITYPLLLNLAKIDFNK